MSPLIDCGGPPTAEYLSTMDASSLQQPLLAHEHLVQFGYGSHTGASPVAGGDPVTKKRS